MPRIEMITDKAQIPEDRHTEFDAIVETLHGVRGPFAVLMHSPGLARKVMEAGAQVRLGSTLSPGRARTGHHRRRQGEGRDLRVGRAREGRTRHRHAGRGHRSRQAQAGHQRPRRGRARHHRVRTATPAEQQGRARPLRHACGPARASDGSSNSLPPSASTNISRRSTPRSASLQPRTPTSSPSEKPGPRRWRAAARDGTLNLRLLTGEPHVRPSRFESVPHRHRHQR